MANARRQRSKRRSTKSLIATPIEVELEHEGEGARVGEGEFIEVEKATIRETTQTQPSGLQNFLNLRETRSYKIVWTAISGIAAFFWIYAILKLFVFDVDAYALNLLAPNFIWLLDYKLFVLLGIVSALFLIDTKSAILAILYIAFYPFLLVFWKLPRFLFRQKSWVLAFAVLNAFIGFFREFKRNVVRTSIWLIAVAVAISASNYWLLALSSICLLLILTLMYVNTFITIFRAPPIFQSYKRIFSIVRSHLNESSRPDQSFNNQVIASLSQEE